MIWRREGSDGCVTGSAWGASGDAAPFRGRRPRPRTLAPPREWRPDRRSDTNAPEGEGPGSPCRGPRHAFRLPDRRTVVISPKRFSGIEMLLADAKPVHARWSEVNREFL